MDNVDSLIDELEKFVTYDFTDQGKPTGKKAANDVLDHMADAMLERTLVQQNQPSGNSLAENSTGYRKRPQKGSKPIGVLTGEMLNRVQMQGVRKFEHDEAIMTYGASTFARDKAEWFTRGSASNPPDDIAPSGAKNQPARPFYELDDEINRVAMEILDQAMTAAADLWNAGGH